MYVYIYIYSCLKTNIEPLMMRQSHLLNVNHSTVSSSTTKLPGAS